MRLMKKYTNRLTVKISEQASSFYKTVFGSTQAGTTYILNALPAALNDLVTTKKKEGKLISSEYAAKLSSSNRIKLDGATLKNVVNPSDYRNWELRLLEIGESRARLAKVELPEVKKIVAPQISMNNEAFYTSTFSKITRGASLILETFPQIYKEIMECLDRNLDETLSMFIEESMRSTAIKHPEHAGEHLLPALNDRLWITGSSLTEKQWEKVHGLNMIERLALELRAAKNNRKTVATGPRISKQDAEDLASVFGATNQGLIFCSEVVPYLYRHTLRTEIASAFSADEMNEISQAMLGCEAGTGHAAGSAVLSCVQAAGCSPGINKKVEGLSLLGRVCLELWSVKQNKKF
jgi:hypothetical protein